SSPRPPRSPSACCWRAPAPPPPPGSPRRPRSTRSVRPAWPPAPASPADPRESTMTGTLSLENLLGCPVFRPGDPGYDDEVAGFNLAVHRAPDVAVGATTTADVVAAVRWAADQGLPVGVQATGHGPAPVDGGLLLSTRRMNRVDVDPVARTATVGAGARW